MVRHQNKINRKKINGHQINMADLEQILDGDVTYENIVQNFEIPVIKSYNIAVDTVDKHAAGEKGDLIALIFESKEGATRSYTYRDLSELSDRFANFLRQKGVVKGDVVACFTGQGLECAMAHLGSYKIGAIVAPLSHLYGPEAVKHVLDDCSPKVIVTQRDLWDRLSDFRDGLKIEQVIVSGEVKDGETDFYEILSIALNEQFCIETTDVDDPALLLYTSGSTGMPKGILHRQGILRGYLSSVSLFYQLDLVVPNQVLWTVSDWSWVAGIFNVMLTGWYFGQTVVAGGQQFSPDRTFDFIQRHGVTHCFLTPTALKRLATKEKVGVVWKSLRLRAIGTGGEPLPGSVLKWANEELHIPVNEFYGLTEVNHLIGNCARLWAIKPGSMGRAYPGHNLAVLDEAGIEVETGTVGEIAARDDDPTLFIGYWKNPRKTQEIRHGCWIRTGDFGYRDDEGYFWYKGREDDLIKSSGYRIGPAEIEDALVGHPSVAEAAVIGVPDPDRGQIIKAFVCLLENVTSSEELSQELQKYVKQRLAFFKYPRLIEFVEEFPLTSTGKINRKELRRREASNHC